MKTYANILRLSCIVLILCLNIDSVYAYDMEINGIYYNIDSNTKTAEVTFKTKDDATYTGSLTIPESIRIAYSDINYQVTSIGERAFMHCTGLKSLTIPKTITNVKSYAFYDVELDYLYIKDLSSWCKITYPANESSIATPRPRHLMLNGNEIKDLVIPNDIHEIKPYAFSGCVGLETIVIPEGVNSIGEESFHWCCVTSVSLPKSLKVINKGAFEQCQNLTSIEIPQGVVQIDKWAFAGCSSLVYVKSNIVQPFDIDKSTFNGLDPSVILHVPNGSKQLYKNIEGWYSVYSFQDIQETNSRFYVLTLNTFGKGKIAYNGYYYDRKKSFAILEGTSVSLRVVPNSGYITSSFMMNGKNVLSQLSNGYFSIESLDQNTIIEAEFDVKSQLPYSLSITSLGSGSVSCLGYTISGTEKDIQVDEGTSVTLTFTPNSGYRIGSLKINNVDVTSSVSNNKYTISSINRNTTVSVTFEAIPSTTYTLSITSSGNGFVSCSGYTISGGTKSFPVNEGASATLTFTPNSGYRIGSLKVNNVDVTSSVSNNKYTISSINRNTTVSVTFEAIPSTTYTLSITSSGSGSVSCSGYTISNGTKSFSVNEGASATLSFTPNNGYRIESLKVNNVDVTSSISNNKFTISSISRNITVSVTFEEIPISFSTLAYDGVVYRVISNVDKTVNVTGGNYSQSLKVMKVPANFYSNDVNWQVKGIDSDVITSNPQLAAVIWNPTVKFDATVSNPNFLLYVTNADYAPSTIKNVIVNGTANSITLTEATSGNDFYCPEAFTARSISYAHNYMMTTGIGESQGWETIALPFDVQTITHSTKGEIIPFAKWSSGASRRPFWLYELTSSGWREASAIKAYTPYIISMPNNDRYYDEARLNGNVTFSATNVRVEPTSAKTAIYQGKTFTPNFTTTSASASIYALNVKNQWTQNTNSQKDGSTFVQNLRTLHPFEAYMSSENSTRSSFPIFEDMTTGIRGIADLIDMKRIEGVYNLKGQKVKVEVGGNLPAGIYIINGQKVIVK